MFGLKVKLEIIGAFKGPYEIMATICDGGQSAPIVLSTEPSADPYSLQWANLTRAAQEHLRMLIQKEHAECIEKPVWKQPAYAHLAQINYFDIYHRYSIPS